MLSDLVIEIRLKLLNKNGYIFFSMYLSCLFPFLTGANYCSTINMVKNQSLAVRPISIIQNYLCDSCWPPVFFIIYV